MIKSSIFYENRKLSKIVLLQKTWACLKIQVA